MAHLHNQRLTMKKKQHESPLRKIGHFLQHFSQRITELSGTSGAFLIALGCIIFWASLGPLFNYSDSWQLVVNTSTTIVTFLMVFLIQRAQNKESIAVQLKLNELLASSPGSNRLIAAESLTEEELETFRQHYRTLVELWKRDVDFKQSHSIEEAEQRHEDKANQRKGSRKKAG